MSPLLQARRLLPLLEIIRNQLGAGESVALNPGPDGSPHLEARTERGSVIATISADGLYMFDTAAGLYGCDPHGAKDTISNTVRQALNDAREEWT